MNETRSRLSKYGSDTTAAMGGAVNESTGADRRCKAAKVKIQRRNPPSQVPLKIAGDIPLALKTKKHTKCFTNKHTRCLPVIKVGQLPP